MKCKTIHNKLIFFLDRELPAVEMKQFGEHLNSCPECALFLEEMKKTLGIIATEKSVEENPFFYTRIKARLENQEAEQVPRLTLLTRVVQPVAFTAILLVGIYGGIKLGKPHQIELTGVTLSEQEIIPFLNEMNSEPIEAFLMK